MEKCIGIREDLLSQLDQISDLNWMSELQINDANIAFYEYLKGLMEHDLHHIDQIKSTIKTGDYTS